MRTLGISVLIIFLVFIFVTYRDKQKPIASSQEITEEALISQQWGKNNGE